jgi:hypothetical protein
MNAPQQRFLGTILQQSLFQEKIPNRPNPLLRVKAIVVALRFQKNPQ